MAEDNEEQTLDLTIEALTGTVYDLCVSPYETILGIKTKLQSLEGIPVYQQQLVYGSNELQDEFCLAEYAIPSGAQLKLLIAMRGGPIHAQRVHLDLEDPTLMEIAEFLDSQAGDKYTVMLVRNGDDLDTANLVRVQMHEDSCESFSCSPVHMSESHKRVTGAGNEESQTEHSVMRDKVKDLMAKLKKVRSYRHPPTQPLTASQPPSSSLQCKPTSKVLILDSRAPSRVLHSSSRGSPLSQAQFNESGRLSTAQRRLMFSCEERNCRHSLQPSRSKSSGKRALRGVSSKRAHSSEEETPTLDKRHPRVSGDDVDSVFCESGMTRASPRPPPLGAQSHDSKKTAKRVRRTSHMESTSSARNANDPLLDLGERLSRLGMTSSSTNGGVAPHTGRSHSSTTSFLPHVSSGQGPVSLTTGYAHSRTSATPHKLGQGTAGSLPPIGGAKVVSKHVHVGKQKNRCMQCSKRVGLASTYSCRCGGMFCASHRYAEAHACTFNYKEEGRRVLARNNPVVTAPKLPKI